MKKLIFFIFIGILIFSPLLSFAAGLVPCGGTPRCCEPGESPASGSCSATNCEPACQLCHFFVLFKNIYDFILFQIVPPLAVVLLAIAGFMFIFAYLSPGEILPGTGKGGPALLSQAKSLISSVIFGLIIIYASWILVNTFFQLVGVADWTGLAGGWRKGWWQVPCP